MTRLLLITLLAVSIGLTEARAGMVDFDGKPLPTVSWGEVIGVDDHDPDEIDGVAIDGEGNTGISGVFRNDVQIGDQTLSSRGEGDIFLASYSPAGQVRWVRQIGGAGDDNTYDLRADGEGNLIASGWFSGVVDFGGTSLQSAGSTDMFVAKFDRMGTLLWAHSFGGPLGDGGNELDVLESGEMVVSAISEGPFTAGGVTYPFGGGNRDSYALRLDSGGHLRWVRPFSGPGNERIRAVALNEAGDSFLGFQYFGVISDGDRTLSSRGGWDGALAKLSAEGAPEWLLGAGGSGVDNVRGAAAGPDGSVYASGQFTGVSQVFGLSLTDDGSGDDYLVRVSPAGVPLWTVTIGGPGTGVGGEIRAWDGGIIVSSLLNGNQTINGPARSLALDFTGTQSSYLASFDSQGKAGFAYFPDPSGPTSGAAPGGALAVTPDGLELAVSLRILGQISLDGERAISSATSNAALVRLALPRPVNPARATIVKVWPRRILLGKRKSLPVKVRIANRGGTSARKLKLCLRRNCLKAGSLGPGGTRVVKLRVSARTIRGRGIRRPWLRLFSANAGQDSVRLRVRRG